MLRKSLLGDYKSLTSNALFLEYEYVSKRKKARDVCPLTGKEITELLGAVYSIYNWVPIY